MTSCRDGTASHWCTSKFKIEVGICIPAIHEIHNEQDKIGNSKTVTNFAIVLVTKSSCDDTSRANKNNPRSNFREIHEQILSSFLNLYFGFVTPKVLLKCNDLLSFTHTGRFNLDLSSSTKK